MNHNCQIFQRSKMGSLFGKRQAENSFEVPEKPFLRRLYRIYIVLQARTACQTLRDSPRKIIFEPSDLTSLRGLKLESSSFYLF